METKQRYWTIFKYCPLIGDRCNTQCLCFNTKAIEKSDDTNIEDTAYCDHFNADCAIRYKRRFDENTSNKVFPGGYHRQDDHSIPKNTLWGRRSNKRTQIPGKGTTPGKVID